MILKEIYLYPDLIEYPDETVHPFRDQSRSICNFLERELKSEKFDAEGFKRVCFVGKSSPDTQCYVNSSKVLIVEIELDEGRYLSLSDLELNDFFKGLLEAGIEKCEKQYRIPGEALRSALKKFKASGYLNEWCFKKKQIRPLGVNCSLDCKLTTKHFHLILSITKNDQTVWRKEILKTEPDEIVFVPMFKDVILEGDALNVVDNYGDSLCKILVKDLGL